MSLVPLKCPSCGADITLDDEKEFGFCSYCGSQIRNDAIQRLKIEYSGDPMSVTNVQNVRNVQNFYTIENRESAQPNMTISKPKSGKLIFGIILSAIAALFLSISLDLIKKENNHIGFYIAGIFGFIGIILIISYFRSAALYSKAVKSAIKSGSITNRK